MPKKIRPNRWIYVAPFMQGGFANGSPIVFDEQTGENLDPALLDDKIKIYERQVNGWFLDHALELKNKDTGGFIILMIAISYIEGVEQYLAGRTSRGNSGHFFKTGLKRIFGLNNVSDPILTTFYHEVRCGLFHTGMTEQKVIINSENDLTIDFANPDEIRINQHKFLDKIVEDFSAYIEDLKDSGKTDKRNNFDRMFSIL